MGRLTTRTQGNIIKCLECLDMEDCYSELCEGVYDALDKLKEYEDLEEQGLLLKLPCKVGDTIYVIGTRCDFGEMPDGGCDEIDCEECYCNYDLEIREKSAKEFHIRKFMNGTAKYEFLTKAEAEKALAEMEK